MGATLHEDRFGVSTVTIDVASVNANTTSEQDFTVTGLKVGDFVAVMKPSHSTGLGVVNARVKSADTLSITFLNATGSGIDPAAESYTLFWFRAERVGVSVSP